jgi:adenine-specific DNA-methyltransferase
LKFRRQQPFGPYIADFCSFTAKLIVELDGGQHAENKRKDAARTKFLERGGFLVIRFWNHEVLGDTQAVLEEILGKVVKSPSPRPSPLKGEGEKQRNNS